MKSQARAEESARRAFYRRGTKKIYIEPLDNTIAVRFREGVETDLDQALRALGQVQIDRSQRLAIVKFPDAARRDQASKQLQQWLDDGILEFVTPVLRDAESQLHQILTDEIAVRFKSALPLKRLRAMEQKYGVTVARQNEFVPNQFIVKVAQPEGLRTLEVASRLDAADEVEFATPNFISEHRRQTNHTDSKTRSKGRKS